MPEPLQNIDHLSRDQKEQYLQLLKEKNSRISRQKRHQYYPEEPRKILGQASLFL